MQMISICIIFLIQSFSCEFLFARLSRKDPFTLIGAYDSLDYLLKDSLENIFMNKDSEVEIMISRSKQVKFSRRIIESRNGNYPQWKLINIIKKNYYEGIHLSKRNGVFMVCSLEFEIDNPFPFSMDNQYFMKINALFDNDHRIMFSGSSPAFLISISKILFKYVNYQIFGSFFIDNQKIYSHSIILKQSELDFKAMNESLFEDAYYVKSDGNIFFNLSSEKI